MDVVVFTISSAALHWLVVEKLAPEEHMPEKNAVFEMSPSGSFRIGVRDKHNNFEYSEWTPYKCIASVMVDGLTYIGVTQYYTGNIPVEQVVRIVLQPTEQFYNVSDRGDTRPQKAKV